MCVFLFLFFLRHLDAFGRKLRYVSVSIKEKTFNSLGEHVPVCWNFLLKLQFISRPARQQRANWQILMEFTCFITWNFSLLAVFSFGDHFKQRLVCVRHSRRCVCVCVLLFPSLYLAPPANAPSKARGNCQGSVSFVSLKSCSFPVFTGSDFPQDSGVLATTSWNASRDGKRTHIKTLTLTKAGRHFNTSFKTKKKKRVSFQLRT